jgi:hypothetical protein
MKLDLADGIACLGALLMVVGVSLVSIPAGVVIAGLLLFAGSMMTAGKRRGP